MILAAGIMTFVAICLTIIVYFIPREGEEEINNVFWVMPIIFWWMAILLIGGCLITLL